MASSLVSKFFGKEVTAVKKLDSYDDNNFRVETAADGVFTLKVRYSYQLLPITVQLSVAITLQFSVGGHHLTVAVIITSRFLVSSYYLTVSSS